MDQTCHPDCYTRKPNGTPVLHCPAADVLVDDGFNQRTDWGCLDELAFSIAQNGIRAPGECWVDDQGRPHLTDGERRLKALRLAIEIGWLTPEDPRAQFRYLRGSEVLRERVEAMLDLNSAKPFTFSERARCYAKLVTVEKGWTAEEVARRRGVPARQVQYYLAFLRSVAPEIQAAVDRDECASTMALELAQAVTDQAEQWAIFQRAARKAGQGVRVTARHLEIAVGKKKLGAATFVSPGVLPGAKPKLRPSSPEVSSAGNAACTCEADASSAASGDCPLAILALIEDIVAEVGRPHCDGLEVAVATLVAKACCGHYADREHFRKTLHVLLKE